MVTPGPGHIVIFTAVWLLGLGFGQVRAEPDGAAICERAIARGAGVAGVPGEVLHSISLTETGRMRDGRLRPWPWAINREGESFWFDSREEALAFARKSVAAGRNSFDVGCFQINYHWHGENFSTLEEMFDPDVGARYAAEFLSALHMEKGDWSLAAGAYHSRTPEHATRYRTRFDRILSRLDGSELRMAQVVESRKKTRKRLGSKPLIIRVEPAATDGDAAETGRVRIAVIRNGEERIEELMRVAVPQQP